MYINNKLLIGKNNDKEVCLLPSMANRHGLITGASGTGKTITSKVMAESFSDLGVPVFMADVKKGDNVIDVCAAPGGKSLHMADILDNTGHIEARDKTEYKVGLIEDNLLRADFKNISTKVWDATVPDESAFNSADIVIADVPCSGLGVLGKKPDIRYRIKEEDLTSLVTLQRDILSAVWQYVKPGGTLMYSTCTLNKAENEENVTWFTKNFPFVLENEADMVTIFPDEYCDGFFIAKLKRTK